MFLQFLCLIVLLFVSAKQSNVYVDEGLCVLDKYTDCDDQVQLMGVCCRSRKGRHLKYYPNECLACKQVLDGLLRAVGVICSKINNRLIAQRLSSLNFDLYIITIQTYKRGRINRYENKGNQLIFKTFNMKEVYLLRLLKCKWENS